MGNLYAEYYDKICTSRQNFEKLLVLLQKETDTKKQLEIAKCAAKYFVYNHTGCFTSFELESFFLDFAQKIKINLSNISYEKNTFLHVLTTGYNTGGHTRVVERWVANAPSEQKHSVIILNPNGEYLSTLEQNINARNGKCIRMDNYLDLVDKALKLRQVAMSYEYVILHVHMEDPIPLLAFGSEDFSRPVLFYNHASHMPWLGIAISDLILDLHVHDDITSKMRNIPHIFYMGIPCIDIAFTNINKVDARKKLNLPIDKKIIVTSGSEFKYRTISGYSYVEYIKQIVDENTICYVIGVSPDNEEWQAAQKETNGKIIPLGYIDFNDGYRNYLAAADLYLDSYPFCGYTATIDAISANTPVVSLASTFPQLDYLMSTPAYCQTVDEFIDKAKRILNDSTYAKQIYEILKKNLIADQSQEAWNKRINKLLQIAPKSHSVKNLSSYSDYVEDNDFAVVCSIMNNSKFLDKNSVRKFSDEELNILIKYGDLYKRKEILSFIEICNYRKDDCKTKVVKVFGVTVFRYTKKAW